MRSYAVFIHIELLRAVPRTGVQHRLIMQFINSLGEHPQTPGDFTDQDASLRTRQIKIIGRYAITYWVDEAVKSVMVVDIQPADQ